MALTGHRPLFQCLNAQAAHWVAQQLKPPVLLRRAQPIFVDLLPGEAAESFQLQPGDLTRCSFRLRSDAPHTSQPVVNEDFMSL